jgi:Domain of unknown function (DUF4188)
MDRIVFKLPESVDELCLVRVGVVVRKLSALAYAARLVKTIDRAAVAAIDASAGLLSSERFAVGLGHHGFLQYWSSFDALDAWSHRPPHSDWWRDALERMRKRDDLGIYHETFLVARGGVESIYLNGPAVGLAKFGIKAEAVGPETTSRDRLGRRVGRG